MVGLVVFFPFGLVLALLIVLDSRGGVFYRQIRVGRNGQEFGLFKFRTMVTNADKAGQLTVGGRDPRITRMGYFLRKSKLDEMPQLLNILSGQMSIVGPRPEVPRYVKLYTAEQRNVLNVRPGLTDYASLEYINENEVLGRAEDPEKTYIEDIMPQKLALNQQYIAEAGLLTDLKIIFKTIGKIIKK